MLANEGMLSRPSINHSPMPCTSGLAQYQSMSRFGRYNIIRLLNILYSSLFVPASLVASPCHRVPNGRQVFMSHGTTRGGPGALFVCYAHACSISRPTTALHTVDKLVGRVAGPVCRVCIDPARSWRWRRDTANVLVVIAVAAFVQQKLATAEVIVLQLFRLRGQAHLKGSCRVLEVKAF